MPHPSRKRRHSLARPHLAPLRLKRPSAIAPNQRSRRGANIAAFKSTLLGSYRPELSGLFRKFALNTPPPAATQTYGDHL
jgi:hypothetical protein